MKLNFLHSVFGLFLSVSLLINPVNAGVIGVFGDYNNSNLVSNLSSLGHTVTYLGAEAEQDLSSYDSVWGVSAWNILSTTEQGYLSSYLGQGGGLYLTGERSCCETLNDSVETFLNSVVLSAGLQIGDLGDAGSSATINSTAIGGLASAPNTVLNWDTSIFGGISGVSGDNIVATSSTTGTTVAAAWDMSDLLNNSGRVMLAMDVNWHSNANGNDLAILENIEVFLSGATANAVSVPEPSVLAIFALVLFGLGARRHKSA